MTSKFTCKGPDCLNFDAEVARIKGSIQFNDGAPLTEEAQAQLDQDVVRVSCRNRVMAKALVGESVECGFGTPVTKAEIDASYSVVVGVPNA